MSTEVLRSQVRLLIPDNKVETVYTDDEIDTFLLLEDDDPRMAAAQALDTLSNDIALTYKHIEVMDVIVDGVSMAKELRYRANDLRARAAAKFEWKSVGFDTVRNDNRRLI